MTNKLVRGRPFLPGESGNPAGRPVGTRTAFSKEFVSDLIVTWRQYGPSVLERVAKTDPVRFLGAAVALCPKDVAVSIQERSNPGNLDPADWAIVMQLLEAIKRSIPDAQSRPPSEILAFVEDAIHAHQAKTITNCSKNDD